MNELPELTQVPAWLAEQIKFARDWWHDDPVCLLPGEEGGHTVFVIEFYDGCKYFGYTRKSVVARVASLMSESGGWGSNAFVREHGGSVPYVVRCVASNMDQRQGRQLRDLLVARAPGDVYVAYGDPVQWVITQDERAAMSDVSVRTQATSDIYEKAGLGPEIRSGELSGAEAERRVRDPDAPKPPSRVQQLEMQVEAQALTIDSLEREVREAKSQVSEYPHEREVVANEREVIISAQTSSIAELQTKLNDQKRRASHFQQKCITLEAESQGRIALP